MEAIGQLTGGIAHDFNNVLTGILSFAGLIQDKPETDREVLEDVGEIKSLALRAKELVRQILTYANNEAVDKEDFDLGELLEETVGFLKKTLPSGISIRLAGLDESVILRGSPTQMHSLIMNVAMNASQAISEKRGEILVTASIPMPDSSQSGDGQSNQRQEWVMLTVKDNGKGMSPETANRLFDPFFTTKARERGTGLGMWVVRNVVNSHGGTIDLESEEGVGTKVKILFPIHSRVAKTAPDTMGEDLHQEARGERIMVVDDERAIAKSARRLLEKMGFEAVEFISGSAALAVFEQNPNEYQVVLTDISMPNFDGLELLQAVRKRRPDLPVILMSGAADRWNEEEAKSVGAAGWLAKPFEKGQLSEVIDKALRA